MASAKTEALAKTKATAQTTEMRSSTQTVEDSAFTSRRNDSDDDDDDVPFVGEIIADKYRVENVLGAGGMGVVVAVTHLQLGERYAIKFLRKRHARDETTVTRFMREARAAARIKSEHVARVSDVGQLPISGAPFILMEYLTGSDLGNVLEKGGPLPIAEAAAYMLQACGGIAETHALGFVHRDIKPSNLFLTQRSDGAPLIKVLDFGIAKALDEQTGLDNPNLTETAAAFGSPSYMSPEQVRSSRSVDFRADIWALGVVLYELVAGVRPFQGETSFATLAAIMADEPRSLRLRRPEVSPELEAVILRCLKKDMTERFQSVPELAEALAPFAREGIVSINRIKRLARTPPGASAPAEDARSDHGAPARTFHGGLDVVAVSDSTTKPAWWISFREVAKRNRALTIVIAVALLAIATIAVVRMPEPRVVVAPAASSGPVDVSMSSAATSATPLPSPSSPATEPTPARASTSTTSTSTSTSTSTTVVTHRAPHTTSKAGRGDKSPPSASSPPPPRDPTAESH